MPTALVDRTLDALANEHRRTIVDLLAVGSVDTPTLGDHFSISKQALNKHLLVLERAGVVERHLDGRVHELRLCRAPLDAVDTWLATVRMGWESSLDRLGGLLEGEEQ